MRTKSFFYKNQQFNRVGTISKEVDELYQNQLLQDKMRAAEEETMQFTEGGDEETEDMDVDMDIDQSSTKDSVSVNVSLNRSGLIRVSSVQAEEKETTPPRPEIRQGRTLTERIKITCA